ncbi:MAG: hypothetical protein IJ167_01750, partial [Lachnospiraceae bacterium]|nr:hypothetical protein [Lachnospiraceae bacterium]
KTEQTTEAVTETTSEEKKEEVTEATIEEKTSEETEKEEITEKEDEPEIIDASDLPYRLLVASEDENIYTDGYVISSYEGMYLVGYKSENERNAGLEYYQSKAIFVELDDEIFEIADNESSDTETSEPEVVNQDDALTALGELEESEVVDDKKVIAVIDTGANDKVADAVSVIGEKTDDDNGHGTKMINSIIAENPNAKILSIKAFDENGKAKPSDIYAAVRYAIDNKVSIINISASSISSKDSEIVEDIINEAIDNKILIVGSAGNKSADAKYFIPGKIDKAYIIGACTEDKVKTKESNFGTSVDYYVVADSTSLAAAIFTGKLSKSGSISFNDLKNVYLPSDIKLDGTEGKTDDEDTDFEVNMYQHEDDYLRLDNIPSTCDGIVVNIANNDDAAHNPVFEYRTKGDVKINQPLVCMDDGYRSGNSINKSSGYDDGGGGRMPVKAYTITNNKFKKFVYYLVVNYSGGDYSKAPTIGGYKLSAYIHKYFYHGEGNVVSGCGLAHNGTSTWADTDARVQAWDNYRESIMGSGWDVPGDVISGARINGSDSTVNDTIYNAALAYANNSEQCPDSFTITELVNFSRGALYVNSGGNILPNWDYQNYLTYTLNYKITLEKSSSVSGYNESMDGVKYVLYNQDNRQIATFTLGANGKTKAIEIYKGQGSIATPDDRVYTDASGKVWLAWYSLIDTQNGWHFEEIASNKYYALDTDNHVVNVHKGDNILTDSDAPGYGMIQVYKTDEKGNTLAGCTFGIYTSESAARNGTVNNTPAGDRAVTANGSNGKVTLASFVGRKNGTYYIKELNAPTGYALDSTIHTVTLNGDASQTVAINNQYYGYVFNSKYYSDAYADLKTAYGTDTKKLATHYFNNIVNKASNPENRTATRYFNLDYYIRNAFGSSETVGSWTRLQFLNHYMNYGAKEGRIAIDPTIYTNMSYGVHYTSGEPVAVIKVKNTPNKYYVGIKKHDADNPNQFIAATFDIYGTNTSGATSGGTKINALSNKSTSATTGLLNVDVSDYYNAGSSTVTGKYKYFYAVETKTDSNHRITVSAKALTVGQNVTYTDWPNAHNVYATLKKSSSNPDCSNNNPNYSLAGAEYKIFRSNADATAAKSSKDYLKAIGTFTVKADGTSNVIDVTDYMNVNTSTGVLRDTTFYVFETKT